VGKIGVPKQVLVKEGALDAAERVVLERHVGIGTQILDPVIYPWDIATLIFQSHERLDGSGYPKGLQGDAIEFDARVIGLSDTFVAMIADRGHRQARDESEVLEYFYEQAGKAFDEACVAALVQVLKGDEDLRAEIDRFTATTLNSAQE